MIDILSYLYKDDAKELEKSINNLIEQHKTNDVATKLSEKDSMIITYGDSILDKGEVPLNVLKKFLNDYINDEVSAVHLLPMFPYTSDDGFSVVDYLKINPELGDWNNINELSEKYDLMFDAVINHISKSSDWFEKYKSGDKEYDDFFIECDPKVDYSEVVRPRSLPLYYEYETVTGKKNLWATFSEDQLDINYQSPKVLVKVLEVLLEYAKNGAKYIRFDAIGFIWKKENTSCIHLEETHMLVKLMRIVLEKCYPNTRIISETNVPHEENITYFGNGYDEAHMVYQFPLPPLTLYSFLSEDATKLSKWADSLKETPLTKETTYFNFLASHDGIGMRPTEGILDDTEKQLMVDNTLSNGGRIGYKNNPDGSKSPYELNINYLDALCKSDLDDNEKTKKFMAAQTILLSLQGVPGIYIHSLLGSRNDIKGMEESNINRRINREKLQLSQLTSSLNNQDSLRYKVLNEYKRLLNIRKNHSEFSPLSGQEVIVLDKRVFSLVRFNETSKLLVLVNVSSDTVTLNTEYKGQDLLSKKDIDKEVVLKPHDKMWIQMEG